MSDIHLRLATIEDAPALARILTETNRDTFQGLVPDRCLTSPTLEQSERNWRRFFNSGNLAEGEVMRVSTDDQGKATGYILAGRSTDRMDYPRELNVLMVDTAWQRQGVGRRLVTYAAGELARQGVKTLLVGILEENPNRGFYERLGAKRVGSRSFNWAGYVTQELLYGWDDLALLAQQK
jgi:GNAT superfamily N-acetyltransferase